jgi:hypothetical protein
MKYKKKVLKRFGAGTGCGMQGKDGSLSPCTQHYAPWTLQHFK